MQKTYQKLRSAGNKRAAKLIFETLKEEKVISQSTWDNLYMEANNISWQHGSFNKLWVTTFNFLEDHGLVTYQMINGLRTYAATQKCWRSKTFENATMEVQEVSNENIDKACRYVKLNNGLVPVEFEGPIVANILGLEGKTHKYFIDTYNYQEEWKENITTPYNLPIKYKVIGVVQNMVQSRHLKKV